MGIFIVNCEDRGTKNHMRQDAWWVSGINIIVGESFTCWIFVYHAAASPANTIISGIFFIVVVIVNGSWATDKVQISADPEMMDVEERTSIGVVSATLSSR